MLFYFPPFSRSSSPFSKSVNILDKGESLRWIIDFFFRQYIIRIGIQISRHMRNSDVNRY